MVGILPQVTTGQACKIHTNILLYNGQEGKRSETKGREKGEGWERLTNLLADRCGSRPPHPGVKINGLKLTIGGDRRLNFWCQEAIRLRSHYTPSSRNELHL